MKLYPYQKEYVNFDGKFDIINKSRQIAYSTAIAYKSIKRCLFENIDQMLVSSSQRQAQKLMSYVELFLDRFYKKRGIKVVKDTQSQKTFSNGKSIYVFPSKPETVRGFPGDVRIDEFALHREDKKMFEALLPSITKNPKYQLSIVSTPLGCGNMFYEIMANESHYPDFFRKTINCYEAIKQGCSMDIDIIKRNFDEESFRQEYECEFIDESTSFFPYELLKSCIEDFENIKGSANMGVDIGRTKDKTGIAVCKEVKEKYYLNQLDTLSNTAFDIQKFTIKQIYKENNVQRCLIDKGAIGYQLAEELEKEINAEGVFTNQSEFMNDVVTFTKKLMEQGLFKMNEDRDLINDFHKIKKKITTSNNITFEITRDNTGHGDRAISVMLALYGFKQNTNPNIRWV